MVKRLRAEGAEAAANSPRELRAVIEADREKWARVIKAASIRVE
jgi:tripartite-type tricarboxylate transporter receptor subunit TctC